MYKNEKEFLERTYIYKDFLGKSVAIVKVFLTRKFGAE